MSTGPISYFTSKSDFESLNNLLDNYNVQITSGEVDADFLNKIETSVSKINSTIDYCREIIDMANIAKQRSDKLVILYKSKINKEVEKYNMKHHGSWADASEESTDSLSDEDTAPNDKMTHNTSKASRTWSMVAKNKPVNKLVNNSAVSQVVDRALKMPSFTTTTIKLAIGATVVLPVVTNEKSMREMPPGMLVLRKGTIDKVALTTGKDKYPMVPLRVYIWQPSDEKSQIKWSRYNTNIKNKGPDSSRFYIDEGLSKSLNIPEDNYRSFRMPSRDSKWIGYHIRGVPTFGDCRDLGDVLKKVSPEDASDIYQISIWYMLVALAHYKV